MRDTKYQMLKQFSLLIFLSLTLQAKQLYSFTTTSLNYLNWSKNSETKTNFKDFSYLEVESGMGWDWGEFYGFSNLQNPTKSYKNDSPNDMRFLVKPILDIHIYENLAFHIQDFYLNTNVYYVNNLVAGLSYKYTSDFGLWIRPFIGVHYLKDTYYQGLNGYMIGWTFLYNFDILEQKFSLFQWHEMEFARKVEQNYGINGSLSFWWHTSKHVILGLQYRYTSNKLGYDEDLSASIYTLKYKF